MQLQQPFNAHEFDPTQGGNFKQLPIGKHPVIIVASEIKATKDNSGGMIVYDLECIDGPAKGNSGVLRIQIYSQNDKAREIAKTQQSALCYVTGVFMLQDTGQLHNIPFAVEIEEQPLTLEQLDKKSQGQTVIPFTQVRKILDINGNEPCASGAVAQTPAPTPAPAPTQAANAWGGGQAQAPAPAPAPAPAQASQPAQGGWSQGGAASAPAATGTPAWGKR